MSDQTKDARYAENADFKAFARQKMIDVATQSHENARTKGWWDKVHDDIVPIKLLMAVSEVDEADDEFVKQILADGFSSLFVGSAVIDGKPEGPGIELADVVIRVLDLLEYLQVDVGAAADVAFESKLGDDAPYLDEAADGNHMAVTTLIVKKIMRSVDLYRRGYSPMQHDCDYGDSIATLLVKAVLLCNFACLGILDECVFSFVDIKAEYNKTRSYRHGNKKI